MPSHGGACDLCIIADLDLRIRELAQFLDRLYVSCTHVRSCNDPQLAAILCKGPQFVHDEAQAAPLDERNQHVDSVAGHDFFLELSVHLRLVNSAGEQAGWIVQ